MSRKKLPTLTLDERLEQVLKNIKALHKEKEQILREQSQEKENVRLPSAPLCGKTDYLEALPPNL